MGSNFKTNKKLGIERPYVTYGSLILHIKTFLTATIVKRAHLFFLFFNLINSSIQIIVLTHTNLMSIVLFIRWLLCLQNVKFNMYLVKTQGGGKNRYGS